MPSLDKIKNLFAKEPALKDQLDDFLIYVRPTVSLIPIPIAFSSLLPGSSRLGGIPDLPEGMKWPTNETRPLTFLAQINLAEATRFDGENLLPKSGWLAFFIDMEFEGLPSDLSACKVLYFDVPLTKLSRTESPEETIVFNPCLLSMKQNYNLKDDAMELVYATDFPEDDIFYSYLKIQDKILTEDQHRHLLLGYAETLQSPIEEGIDLGQEGKDWTLLLQLDTDQAGPGFEWGDSGLLYFYIKYEDLAQKHFDRTYLAFQCC